MCFLQETLTDERDDAYWELRWGGKLCLSHGSNISAGVSVHFSPALSGNVLAKWEIEKGAEPGPGPLISHRTGM